LEVICGTLKQHITEKHTDGYQVASSDLIFITKLVWLEVKCGTLN